MAILSFDTYGKTAVRLTQVTRAGGRHEMRELSVDIFFEGDFADSYTLGDNSNVLPTDTMKNTVYALARQNGASSIESFARDLGLHFLTRVAHLSKVRVLITEMPWSRIGKHETAFLRTGGGERRAELTATRSECTFVSGIRNMQILKTANSGFTGFIKDEYTTLRETQDRLFGTVMDASWRYAASELDFDISHHGIRHTLLDAFAEHRSLSVQHTLYYMAQTVIDRFEPVNEVYLRMPNKHCLLVDLSRFGLDNPNQVFVPTDEPSGYIEAHVERT